MSAMPRHSYDPLRSAPLRTMDPTMRRHTHGPLRPMDSDLTWWEKLLRR